MSKIITAHWIKLRDYWESYGHSIPWDQLEDIKSNNGLYAVVMWREGRNKDILVCADLERAGHDQPWEMNNDGSDPITQEQWDRLTIPEECSWFEVPSEEELQQEEHDRLLDNPKYSQFFFSYREGHEDAGGRSEKMLKDWFGSQMYETVMALPGIRKKKKARK